ncbi:glycoside hydrolase family 2 TIM barrel-domain containing protein [Corallococcus sp. 4LFB]|uniref:glycoside hydrolase family 2 TIM barrel-domain containing protein n=1 Tax=Corallococcus sp. 4LFB TaxID=3383249 RepID=UPI003975E166
MATARPFAAGVLLLTALLFPAWNVEARTAIVKAGEGWKLEVDGQPYVAKGVTFSGTGGAANFDRDCAQLRALGVNTLRTWGAGEETPALLDAAHKHGLHVLVGLWLRPGRAGMENDDAFDYVRDAKGREAQLQATLAQVRRFKDHPAVLAWGLGNEVILNSPDEPSKVAYARFLEKVVRAVKKADPGHPVLSVDAWTLGVPLWEKYGVTSATPLDVSFAYNFRGAATRTERDRVTVLESRKGATPGTWRVRLPSVTGAIKLYGLAKDDAGNLVAATTSVAASP